MTEQLTSEIVVPERGASSVSDAARLVAAQQALRSPVHTVIGYAHLVLEESGGEERSHAGLQSVIQMADDLLELIDEVVHTSTAHGAGIDQAPLALVTEKRTEAKAAAAAIIDTAQALVDGPFAKAREEIHRCLQGMVTEIHGFAKLLETETGGDINGRELAGPLMETVERALSISGETVRDEDRVDRRGAVLVTDDEESMRLVLSHCLKQKGGHRVITVSCGEDALNAMRTVAFDVVMLDILMPGMNGYEVLRAIKKDPALMNVPVVMLSGLEHAESLARCLDLGADDYITKPFDPALLTARIASTIEKKRLRDRERTVHNQLLQEQQRSHELLLNILPASIARRLEYGQKMIANHFESATVLFADLVGFTPYSSSVAPFDLVQELNRVFKRFDTLVVHHKVEKIKTIGDAYLAVGGVPEACDDHAERVARLALDMLDAVKELNEAGDFPLQVRIGIHTGPVTAGVIGELKFAYDLWGDTVNVAARMESTGLPGAVHISEITHDLLGTGFAFQEREPVTVKGKGAMSTWLLSGPAGGADAARPSD